MRKQYRDVSAPLVSASKAIIKVDLPTPQVRHGQNPVYLSRSMNWDNPHISFPVLGTPHISPQFSVACLVMNLGEHVTGEDCTSLGVVAARRVIREDLSKHHRTTINAGVIEEGCR